MYFREGLSNARVNELFLEERRREDLWSEFALERRILTCR